MPWAKSADMIVHEHDPFNAETPRASLLRERTGAEAFYVRNHGPVPSLDDVDGWQLTVDGLVDHQLHLSVADLHAGWEHVDVEATLQCAGNRRLGFLEVRDIPGEDPWGPGATSTALWTGVRLTDVLASAGVAPDALHVAFAAPDVSQIADPPQAFGGSIPIDKATAPEVLLVWAMDGEPLPAVHGGPLRVVVPGYIGARSVKWVQRITPQAEPSGNFFQTTAYRLLPVEAEPAPGAGVELTTVALNADILRPEPDARLAAGPVEVAGYAYAGGDRTVVRVDVSTDGGATWTQADLGAPRSPWAWRHWHAVLDLAAGEHDLVARAWDSAGASMPESAESLWNPKGYINNAWARQSLHVT